MNLKDEDLVSAVALVVDTGEDTAAPAADMEAASNGEVVTQAPEDPSGDEEV
jgi:hypothetical protein